MKYKKFEYFDEETNENILIQIDPKKGVARIHTNKDSYPNMRLRELLIENKWKIHTCILSSHDIEDKPVKNVYLLRGDKLLEFLKEPDTHNDSVKNLIPEQWHKSINEYREYLETVDKNTDVLSGVLVFCPNTGKFLLHDEGNGYGGFYSVIDNDTPETTAALSLFNNTGLQVDPKYLLPIETVYDNNGVQHKTYLLRVKQEVSFHIDIENPKNISWMSSLDLFNVKLSKVFSNSLANDVFLQNLIQSTKSNSLHNKIVDTIMDDDPDPDNDPTPPKRYA